MSAAVLTEEQLDRLDSLAAEAVTLTARRDEMRSAWSSLRVPAAGADGYGHRTFATLASLGAQLAAVERRIGELLSSGGRALPMVEA